MVSQKPKTSKLGANPLSAGIFSKTTVEPEQEKPKSQIQESRKTKPALPSRAAPKPAPVAAPSSRGFLELEGEREKLNLRVPLELADWLDDLLRTTKRRHGRKIPKEVWIQAALELLRAMPVEWEDVDSEDALRTTLLTLQSRFQRPKG